MPNSLVAIVGRPNVGKSTLFNRVVGRREAIVSDIPGTTRDRLVADVSWDDFPFTLVDTGGLEPRPQDPLRDQVKAQVEMAVEEADAIIFLVDVTDGLMPMDHEIAELLRRTRKPIVVAVSKVDNPRRELMVVDFFQLGLGDPLPISAFHNLGIDDLMARVQFLVPPASDTEEIAEGVMRLAIVGRTNVGKSMLLNTILGQERAIVSEVAGTTRDALDTHFDYEGEPVVLIDTAGMRRPGAVKPGIERYSVLRAVRAVQRCDIALVVMDVSDLAAAQDAHIAGLALDAYKGMVVVVNKWDLVADDVEAPEMAVQAVRRCLRFAPNMPICFTSALRGTGINDLMMMVRSIYNERFRRVPAGKLFYALNDALARHPPSTRKDNPIIITGVRQVDVNPPTFVFAVNRPSLVHFSYRRYLENHLRQTFEYTHTHLRILFRKGG